MKKSKVVSLREAIQLIDDGDTIFLGGIVEDRRPVAAAMEMVRQRKKNLVLLGTCSLSDDILVGGGCVEAYRGCYTSNGAFGISPNMKRRAEAGTIITDEIGHLDLSIGLLAAMAGVPFIASKTCIGSDVLNPAYDNLSRVAEVAAHKEMLPRQKYVLMEDPFFNMGTVQLVPAIKLDACICHVQMAGEEGTVRIDGSLTFDHYAALAAKKVIVTAEKVVPESYIRQDPNRNCIPSTSVDLVVELPWGAHPGQVYNAYDMDIAFLQEYARSCATQEGFDKWAEVWIFNENGHEDYINKLGASRLEKLRARPPYGYVPRSKGGVQ
ncbi:MAG: CoA-transferase [Syntrophomonadaceae bacterium]